MGNGAVALIQCVPSAWFRPAAAPLGRDQSLASAALVGFRRFATHLTAFALQVRGPRARRAESIQTGTRSDSAHSANKGHVNARLHNIDWNRAFAYRSHLSRSAFMASGQEQFRLIELHFQAIPAQEKAA